MFATIPIHCQAEIEKQESLEVSLIFCCVNKVDFPNGFPKKVVVQTTG
jgi:hypothetical protein